MFFKTFFGLTAVYSVASVRAERQMDGWIDRGALIFKRLNSLLTFHLLKLQIKTPHLTVNISVKHIHCMAEIATSLNHMYKMPALISQHD